MNRKLSFQASTPVDAQKVKKVSNKILKRVGDKVRVGMALFDDVATSLAKATNHDKVPPKEKHVRRIIIATHGSSQDLNFGLLVDTMGKIITDSKDWLVSLKALQLFHRLVQEGSEEFIETVLRHNVNKVLNMSSWKDRSTAEAMEQSPFVRQYARFLEERVVLYRNLQIKQLEPQMALPIYTTAKDQVEELFRMIASFQRITEELLECFHLLESKDSRLGNASTVGAFNLLLDDALSLFKLTSDANLKLLDGYFDMNKINARRGIELCEVHCRHSKDLLELFKFAKKSGASRRKIPALKATPDTILEAMREYLGDDTGSAKSRLRSEVNDEEVSTMNLADILTPQELEFIRESVSNSVRSDDDTTNSESFTDELSPRARQPSVSQQPSRRQSSQIRPPQTPPPQQPQSSLLEFTPQANTSPSNNMLSFDDFMGNQPLPQQVSPSARQQYSPPNVMYGNTYQQPPPQQVPQQQHMMHRVSSNPSFPQQQPPQPQYYSNPQWGVPPQNMAPPMARSNSLNANMPMNRQQEMILRQQMFKQQYVQDQFQQQPNNPYTAPQQQQQQQDANPFDDPFADMPLNPQQEKQAKSANVLHSFDF